MNLKYPLNDTIQGCRALAILMVFVLHLAATTFNTLHLFNYYSTKDIWHYLFISGNTGVDILFIISGYVSIKSIRSAKTFGIYIYRRIIRIYPVFIVILFATYVYSLFVHYRFLSSLSDIEFIKNFLYNLFLLPGVFNIPSAQPVSWTISYLFVFYILWGLAYKSFRSPFRLIRYGVSISCVLGYAIFTYYHPRMISLIIGIILYYSEPIVKRYMNDQNIVTIVSLLSFILMVSLFSLSEGNNTLLIFIASSVGYAFFVTILSGNALIVKLLNTRFMIFLGNISYSFYLIHINAIFLVNMIFLKFHWYYYKNKTTLLFFYVTSFLVSIILSWISYLLIEDLLTKKFFRKDRQ
jgi:peptidoglycan/LPS O-acetylase OafA/YrhL